MSLVIERLVNIDVEIKLEVENIEKNDEMANKLDSLMTLCFTFLDFSLLGRPSPLFKSTKPFNHSEFEAFFQNLLEIAEEKLIIVYNSKYVQFILFYLCSFIDDYPHFAEKFLSLLISLSLSKTRGRVLKLHCLAYLSSFLARARYLPPKLIVQSLDFLLDYLLDWEANSAAVQVKFKAIKNTVDDDFLAKNQDYYQKLQSVLYIFCFNEGLIGGHSELLGKVLKKGYELGLMGLVSRDVREEFSIKCKRAGLNDIVEDLLSEKVINRKEEIEFFFPFDPYLLRKSSRFIMPCYNLWKEKEHPSNEGFFDSHETDSSSPWIERETLKRKGVFEDTDTLPMKKVKFNPNGDI